MRTSLPLVFSLLACSLFPTPSASAQANRDDLTPLEISYHTRVSDDQKSLHITLDVENIARPATHVAMPNWTPGAYGIGRYGERVQDLVARGSAGTPLEVTRIDHQTWSIATEGQQRMRVTYSLPIRRGGRRGPPRPQESEEAPEVTGFRISGPNTYLYVRGAKQIPVTASYQIPEGWRIANGLLHDGDPLLRRARDFDTFIDAPTLYGQFRDFEFEINGTPFSCVFFENSQSYDFDIEAFVEVCRKIAQYQGDLFGSFPFPFYVFLFTLPGGGGLEHLNSTTIGLNPTAMKEDVKAGASVTAHEFFHAWNVKRIRPQVLGPFEYEHENYTGNLWVSEGWTSYYGDLTMVRTGIIGRDEFLGILERILRRELNKESRKQHSVYWASRNVWHRDREAPPRVDYYGTGQYLGALIDLTMRNETDNAKSLDDVMRFLNRWFAENDVGFEEGDVERACTAISNHDFSEFFARHVYGTVDPPLKEVLAYAGIAYEETVLDTAFAFDLRSGSQGLRISGRRGAEVEAGVPSPGDRVLTIDGAEVTELDEFLAQHKPGDKVVLAIERGEETFEAEVTLIEKRQVRPHLHLMEDASEQQQRIRESWLSGK